MRFTLKKICIRFLFVLCFHDFSHTFHVKIKATRFHLFKNLKPHESFNQRLWRYKLEMFSVFIIDVDDMTKSWKLVVFSSFLTFDKKKLVRWLAANGGDWDWTVGEKRKLKAFKFSVRICKPTITHRTSVATRKKTCRKVENGKLFYSNFVLHNFYGDKSDEWRQ